MSLLSVVIFLVFWVIVNTGGKTVKRRLLLCAIGITGVFFMACSSSCFAGIFYPKVWHDFYAIDKIPSSASARLEAGSKYPQAITFLFSQAGNTFEKYFLTTIFTQKLYRFLHVKTMAYEYEGVHGIFFRNKTFTLSLDDYIEENGWYWRGGVGRSFFHINFERVFRNKKPGDEFLFKILLTYSFDEDEEITQVIEYNVHVVKGEYHYPFGDISLF